MTFDPENTRAVLDDVEQALALSATVPAIAPPLEPFVSPLAVQLRAACDEVERLRGAVLRPLSPREVEAALHEGRAEAMAATGDNAWTSLLKQRDEARAQLARVEAERDEARREVERLKADNEALSQQYMADFVEYKKRRNDQFAAYELAHRAVIAYLLDRAEQYKNSSRYRAFVDELVDDIAIHHHVRCAEAGEYDDLMPVVKRMIATRVAAYGRRDIDALTATTRGDK